MGRVAVLHAAAFGGSVRDAEPKMDRARCWRRCSSYGLQVGSTATFTPVALAAAANGADFDAGMIISDEVFYNPGTMSGRASRPS